MIKAIVFDLDDTLISEKEYIKSGFQAISEYICKKYDLQFKKVLSELMTLSEVDSKNVFNRFFDENKIKYTKQEIKKMITIYRNHRPNITFYEDVLDTVEQLKQNNIKISIITDGYIETQKSKLEAINAYEIFDAVIITEELGREYWKPHPKAFEIIKEKLNVNFEEMMYVGDNPEKDFYIGKIYPINTVRIIRTDSIYKNQNYLNDIKEKYTINSLIQIIKLIYL